MPDTCCDMTHRAYEYALGEGLGFWESSTTVTSGLAVTPAKSGLLGRFGGSRRQQTGTLMLHVFDGGLVVERNKGAVFGACYTAVTATLLDLDSTPGSALSLTFEGSRTLLLTPCPDRGAQTLAELAGRCGASTTAQLSRAEAERAFGEPDWI